MVEREPAKKVRIVNINNGKYFPGSKEEMKPSYVITQFGEKISRVNIVVVILEKYLSENENYSSVTIDDGSGVIRAKSFGEGVKVFDNVEVGDLALIIGKIKNYNGETYISCEVARKLTDPNFENLWKLEIIEKLIKQKKIVENIKKLREELSEEELEAYVKERYEIDRETLEVILESKKTEVDYKPKILEIIERLDEGEGVEIGKLLEFLNLDERIVESDITELLSNGSLYEPKVGFLKKV